MKIVVLLFSVLFVQTSASFFSELSNSVSLVQSSIGKLISDAAVDLKDTFDCTVFVVRRAFSGDSTLPGYEKCLGNTDSIIPVTPSTPVQIYIIPPPAPAPPTVSKINQLTNRNQKNLETISNPTINNKEESQKKNNVENYLLNETRILVNISDKLEHEFENLSKHVNDDLGIIKTEQKQQPIEKAIKEIDKLVELEVKSKNNTDSEIHEAFDKILTKLDKNNTDKFDLKQDTKSALTELEENKTQTDVEHQLKIWKEEELKSLHNINILLEKQNDTIKPDRPLPKTSNTSRATTETVISASVSAKTTLSPRTVQTTKATTSSLVALTTSKPVRTTQASTRKPPNDFDYLVSNDKSTLDSVRKLLGTSKQTEAIMAAILKRKNPASSIFDRTELFR